MTAGHVLIIVGASGLGIVTWVKHRQGALAPAFARHIVYFSLSLILINLADLVPGPDWVSGAVLLLAGGFLVLSVFQLRAHWAERATAESPAERAEPEG